MNRPAANNGVPAMQPVARASSRFQPRAEVGNALTMDAKHAADFLYAAPHQLHPITSILSVSRAAVTHGQDAHATAGIRQSDLDLGRGFWQTPAPSRLPFPSL